MARRGRKTKRTYRRRQVSLLSALELFSLTSIMAKGLTGYGPWEFFTQAADITPGEGWQ